MARAAVLPLLFAASVCVLVLRGVLLPHGGEQGAFVNPQLRSSKAVLAEQRQEGQQQLDLSPWAAAVPSLAAALVPEAASAATQQELNRFGFVFAVIFLLFFLAAFARLLTVGKL
mmetsp:Transcript_97304/g.258486  ORF Transcript_97304/g.258486 Transcript_97304/m.258486 type:complete len:115 (-) Transcript_97304:75-419(-)